MVLNDSSSHVDEFEIAYSNYQNQTAGTANGISFISGALTPISKAFSPFYFQRRCTLIDELNC